MRLKSSIEKLLTKRGRKALYISEDVEVGEITNKVDIILSPKFYWIRIEELNVKKEKEALKFAPSIFEGQFEESSSSYRYLAIKGNENKYIFIAYNPKTILFATSSFNCIL